MIAASQAGSRGEEWVPVEGLGELRQPPGMLPPVLDALLAQTSTSSAQLSHRMRNSACRICCWVCARTTCSGQWCAQVLHARVCPCCACAPARTSSKFFLWPFLRS